MPDPQELEGLALRCEQASGADRELDAKIHVQATYAWPHVRLTDDSAPRYTASLDAAMSLVPEGYEWIVRKDPQERTAFANIIRQDHRNIVDTYDPEDGCFKASDTTGTYPARAATPALALTAAALRARALSGIRHEG